MRLTIAPAAVRTWAAAPFAALALAGCTVIPSPDPARMPAAYPQAAPQDAPQPYPSAEPVRYPAPRAEPAAPRPPVSPPAYPPQTEPPTGTPLAFAALGQTANVGGPRIIPLEVLEDSRCPMNARCVWAGQLKLRLRIDSGSGGIVEITSGRPITVADGTLELVEVRPDKVTGGGSRGGVKPSEYRFGFRFMGGY